MPHIETAFVVFRFVHGYAVNFEFKIFATAKFRAFRGLAKKLMRKPEMRGQVMRKRQLISCTVQMSIKMSYPNFF